MQADSFVSDKNVFINSWLQSMATWGERYNSLKPMLTILCWPHPNARCILWCLRSQFISASRDWKNLTARHNSRKLNCPFKDWILNYCLFKILKFSGPSLLGMTSSTLQSHFLSGVYYDKWWLSYYLHTGIRQHHQTMHQD